MATKYNVSQNSHCISPWPKFRKKIREILGEGKLHVPMYMGGTCIFHAARCSGLRTEVTVVPCNEIAICGEGRRGPQTPSSLSTRRLFFSRRLFSPSRSGRGALPAPMSQLLDRAERESKEAAAKGAQLAKMHARYASRASSLSLGDSPSQHRGTVEPPASSPLASCLRCICSADGDRPESPAPNPNRQRSLPRRPSVQEGFVEMGMSLEQELLEKQQA